MRTANILIQTLESLQTQTIFSLSGNQIMPIYDAWIDSEIELIHVRHEAAAVHMADAWGRLTGKPGVALLTAGPGFANAISAMYVALMAESPLVILSGHAPLSNLDCGAFQEMPQAEMAKSVTKASWLVQNSDRLEKDLLTAFQLSNSGRPGPVHLSLPFDVLNAESLSFKKNSGRADLENIQTRADSFPTLTEPLLNAEKPLVLAGPALMRSKEFQEAVLVFENIGIPLIGMESPRGILDPALGAFPEILAEADLLVLLGKKLDFTLKFGQSPFIHPQTQIIQIDSETSVLDLSKHNMKDRQSLFVGKEADPQKTLKSLVEEMKRQPSQSSQWSKETQSAIDFRPSEWNGFQGNDLFHPVEVGKAIHDFLADAEDSIFISDGGEFGQWMQACVQAKYRVINGPSGSIGNAVPFAAAARLAFPNSRIVACTGDGAFGFHPFEIDTAVRYHIPFTVVIGNDACWNAEYQIQLSHYGQNRVKGCELLASHYHEVARNLGAWGQEVARSDSLSAALDAAEKSNLPACLNISIQRQAAPQIKRE